LAPGHNHNQSHSHNHDHDHHCRVGLSHRLEDEDVVQLVKKKNQTGEDGKGRFATTGANRRPDRIADREKKAALKS